MIKSTLVSEGISATLSNFSLDNMFEEHEDEATRKKLTVYSLIFECINDVIHELQPEFIDDIICPDNKNNLVYEDIISLDVSIVHNGYEKHVEVTGNYNDNKEILFEFGV